MSKAIDQERAILILEALCERFGIAPDEFAGFVLYQGSKGKVYAHHELAPELPGAAIVGLHIATVAKTVKPATNFVQIFGETFTRNVITVSTKTAKELISGMETLLLDTIPENVTNGYIALACDSQPFMCGLLKDGVVRSMLPKSRRRALEFI